MIDALGLEDIAAEDIGADLALFGEGLGLDS
ncbi:MAG: acyl carrier protein, partial [Pseudomonas sp.]|nr:acyl carrier protein [Pseudomonas sp.]